MEFSGWPHAPAALPPEKEAAGTRSIEGKIRTRGGGADPMVIYNVIHVSPLATAFIYI